MVVSFCFCTREARGLTSCTQFDSMPSVLRFASPCSAPISLILLLLASSVSSSFNSFKGSRDCILLFEIFKSVRLVRLDSAEMSESPFPEIVSFFRLVCFSKMRDRVCLCERD